ncbi:MAG: DUF2339 domain-containing protein, partial [Rhodobiaceae bacterium]|nr:DUF2339 domain-containing protein [Rhodobiaceae bacterium]
VGSGVSLGLLQLRRTGQSRTLSLGASILGLLGMAMAVAGLIVAYNPMVTFDPVGPGLFFNALWFAYLATGLVFGLLALSSRGRRPAWYTNAAFATAGLLMAAFVTLTIRLGFHPGNMALGPTPDAELYTYSGVWLAIGIVVLAGGIWRGSRTLRLVSAGIIVAVVVKVFLIDMANLTGVLRAFSFVSLGAVLLAIGFVYQRLLRKE